jgi:hypothetical protein
MTSRARRWRTALGAMVLSAAIVAFAAPSAPAQERPPNPGALPPRLANYAWDHNLLRASFSYRDVLSDPLLANKLSNGLKTVIAMRAYVYREKQDTPVALTVRSCEVAYDLWEEVYRVHVDDPESKRDQAVLDVKGVLRLCTEVQNLPVVGRALLTAGESYFLGVVVEVNPVSQDMLDQMRRWMSRPTGSTGIAPTDALFGGFVQLFVRQIASSDKTLTFRTQDVVP